MWKKFSALFVLAIFLLSMIPLAFAEDNGNENDSSGSVTGSTETAGTDNETGDDYTPTLRTRQRINTELETNREIAKAELTRAREQYQMMKEDYQDVKDAYMKERRTFLQAKEDYKDCRDSKSDDCEQERTMIKKYAQPHLLRAADLVIKELERVKAKVQASEDLSEDEIAEIVADLDKRIQEVQDAKSVIENLDENSSREDINKAAKTIRNAWQRSKISLKKHLGRLVNARLGNIILRTEQLEKRLYNARDKLVEKGADVSELDDMLADFSADLDTAAEKYNEARKLWSGANTPGEVDDVAKQVHSLMEEAKDSLKDAREKLRDVVREIKQLNSGNLDVAEEDDKEDDNSDSSSDTEVEEEDEEELEEENETEVDDENDDSCTLDTDCDSDESCQDNACEDIEDSEDSEHEDKEGEDDGADGSEEDSEEDEEE